MNDNNKNRIRVGVILIEDNKVLLVRMHREQGEDIFVLPGGGIEKGEDIIEAMKRETKEETNLDIEVNNIVYFKSLYTEDEGALEIIGVGSIIGGELQKGFDPEDKGKNVLSEVKFVDLSEFSNINFHPKQLRTMLEQDYIDGFNGSTKYLGNYQYPEGN